MTRNAISEPSSEETDVTWGERLERDIERFAKFDGEGILSKKLLLYTIIIYILQINSNWSYGDVLNWNLIMQKFF